MLVLASASPRRHELLAQAGYSFEVHPAHIPEEPYPNEDPIAYVTRLAREKALAVYAELTLNWHGFSHAGSDSRRAGASETVEKGKFARGMPGIRPAGPKGHVDDATRSARLKSCPDTEPSFSEAYLATEGVPPETLAVLGADTTVALDDQILGKPESPADAARMLRLLSGRTHRVLTGVALVTATSTQVAAESTAVTFLPLSGEEIDAYIATGEPMDKAGAYAIQGRAARWIPRIEGCYFNVVGLPIALVSSLLGARPAR